MIYISYHVFHIFNLFWQIWTTSASVFSRVNRRYTHLFYKQHSDKQQQAEIWQQNKQKLSNTLRPNFRYLKITRFLHLRYHPKAQAHILKNVQKTSASVLMRLWMTIKMRLKIKQRLQRYDINSPRTTILDKIFGRLFHVLP